MLAKGHTSAEGCREMKLVCNRDPQMSFSLLSACVMERAGGPWSQQGFDGASVPPGIADGPQQPLPSRLCVAWIPLAAEPGMGAVGSELLLKVNLFKGSTDYINPYLCHRH